MPYRLQTLLDLRQRAEDEAARSWAVAGAALALSLNEQSRLAASSNEARQRAASVRDDSRRREPFERAADVVAAARHLARLDDEAQRRFQEAAAHREGPLAEATAAESAARDGHLVARRDREILERHRDREEAAARRIASRRQDAENDDVSRRPG